MSRTARLARLEEALPTVGEDLCLKCLSRADPARFRERMRELSERARTSPNPSEGMTPDQFDAYLSELRHTAPPCPRCGTREGSGR